MNQGTVPQRKPFYVQEQHKNMLVTAVKMNQQKPVNILVMGKPGCGKTELGEQLAAKLNRPYFLFQMGLLAESGQLLGNYIWNDGHMVFQEHLFLKAVQTPNAIIGLDEINRAEHPRDCNALMNLLDDTRSTWVNEVQKTVNVAKGVMFWATINEGYEFSGTNPLDAALRDRFLNLRVDWMTAENEKTLLADRVGLDGTTAYKLSNIYHEARRRNIQLSTRQGLAVAESVAVGLSIEDSFEFVLGGNRSELEEILISLQFKEMESRWDSEETVWTKL